MFWLGNSESHINLYQPIPNFESPTKSRVQEKAETLCEDVSCGSELCASKCRPWAPPIHVSDCPSAPQHAGENGSCNGERGGEGAISHHANLNLNKVEMK